MERDPCRSDKIGISELHASNMQFQRNIARIALCGAEVTPHGNRRWFQLACVEQPLRV
jgi:hypothetical protein